MALTPQEINEWANAYIAAEELPEKERHDSSYWWAIERFMNMRDSAQADDGWTTILKVLDGQPSQNVIGMLAAGPLEDLIQEWGELFVDRIELEARRNPAFRHLLGGVWESSTPEVWARIEKARGTSW
jgi:hypothetical protein